MSFFRSSIVALAVLLSAAGGLIAKESVLNACRLPAVDLVTASRVTGAPSSPFSSLRRRSNLAVNFAGGSIQFFEPTFSVNESESSAMIFVVRTDSSLAPVTVDFATSDGTAVGGQDYTPVFGTLFWEGGDASVKSFTIPISNDSLSESSETVNITLSNPVGASLGSPSEAVLTIIDNDGSPTLSINDVTQAEGNGPNTLTFTVSLSGASQAPVTVNYATVNGTATAPSDFTAIPNGQVTFGPGELSKPIGVGINGDTAVEPDESFSVQLSNSSNAAIADGSGTATLLNDDTASALDTVQFSSTAFSVNESVANATVTVTRTGTGDAPVSVNYATSNGSATAGQDYTAVSGTLSWPAGDLSAKSFTIPITEDSLQENNETINVALSSPSGANIGTPGTSVLTILDNDTIPEISIADVSQLEGNGVNTMAFTVSLSNSSGQAVSLHYSTENGTAAAGSDFVGVSNGLLTFSPGETSKQILINVLGDFVVEPDENFLVNLTDAAGGSIVDSQAVGTIRNDDTPGTIQFQSANFAVNEGDGSATVTITRSGGLSQGVTVRFVTVDGSALSGEDFANVRTIVSFEPDQASKTVTIPIVNDLIDEPDETVNLALESPTGGAVLGSPINAILTIVDNDPAPTLSINDLTQNEGNSGTTNFNFTISLQGQSSQPVTVLYSTANGTATSPSDYVAVQQGSVTFDPGQTSKSVSVAVVGDFNTEPNEAFFVNLEGPAGATIGDGQGQGTITNDDVGGAFRFTASSYTVGEPAGTIAITVQRTGGLADGAAVNYSTANGTATAALDYTPVAGTLTFSGGQTTRSFNVPIANDGIAEADETFTVILSSAGGGSTLGVPNTASVVITDRIPEPERKTLFDYDGDGKSDLSVRRPSDNNWYLLRGTAGYTAITWGVNGDRPAPADYDGDGTTDVVVFRPSNGFWYVFYTGTQVFQTFGWGQAGDLPVPTDRDGDGKTDLVVYRESNNTWYTRSIATGSIVNTQFGVAGDKPVRGDFDGDGRGDDAVYRPSNNTWYVSRSGGGLVSQAWGQAGDVPVPADYDGDLKTDIAIFRPSSGQWFRINSSLGFDVVNWGQTGDVPIPADFDGDGKADTAVFRPGNGSWYMRQSAAGFLVLPFGQSGDVPTQSSFIY